MSHNANMRHGTCWHAHTNVCINCGSGEGDTRLEIRVVGDANNTWFRVEYISNSLCPRCRADLVPLTPANDKHLTQLSDELWDALKKRGCPCCAADLDWHPSPQRH
jgi:hypothetical protein